MARYGHIESYNSARGRGSIKPESGGAPLHFVEADLPEDVRAPKPGDRYAYKIRQVGGDKPQAIHLEQQHPPVGDAEQ